MRSPIRAAVQLFRGSPIPFTSRAATFAFPGLSQSDTTAQMRAYGRDGVLFPIVNRLANSTAQATWRLYRKTMSGSDEEREEVAVHPALKLLDEPNSFFTRQELFEVTQQHIDLTGEGWWVLDRARGFSQPVGVWPVRPDLMQVVPDREKFIRGYIYHGPDGEMVPLEPQDVVLTRMPDPMDPYRGLGPVQAAMIDIDSAQYAREWNRQFFINSAEPGGIIEIPNSLSDRDFDKLSTRWNEQHKGVANAHRVAIIEQGKWVDRKYTMRDMEFTKLRDLGNEAIRRAFGFPVAMLGDAGDVNRATALAAELIFARWLLVPRLERLRGALNNDVLPQFPRGGSYEFDFDDPTPIDVETANADRDSRIAAVRELVNLGFDPAEVLQAFGFPPFKIAVAPVPTDEPDEDEQEEEPDDDDVDDAENEDDDDDDEDEDDDDGGGVRGFRRSLPIDFEAEFAAIAENATTTPHPSLPSPPPKAQARLVSGSTNGWGEAIAAAASHIIHPNHQHGLVGIPGPPEITALDNGELAWLHHATLADGSVIPLIRNAEDPEWIDPNELPDVTPLESKHEEIRTRLLAEWELLEGEQKNEIAKQVRILAAEGSVRDIPNITVDTTKTQKALFQAMIEASDDAAAAAAREAAEQGVTLKPVGTNPIVANDIAAVVAGQQSQRLVGSAVNTAMRVNSESATPDSIEQAVRDALQDLSPKGPAPALSGALTGVQNDARINTLRKGPEGAIYASEVNDQNTCGPCRAIDGKWLGNISDIEYVTELYPGGAYGGYIKCDGRERCRGTITGVWRQGAGDLPPEEKPPAEKTEPPVQPDQPTVAEPESAETFTSEPVTETPAERQQRVEEEREAVETAPTTVEREPAPEREPEPERRGQPQRRVVDSMPRRQYDRWNVQEWKFRKKNLTDRARAIGESMVVHDETESTLDEWANSLTSAEETGVYQYTTAEYLVQNVALGKIGGRRDRAALVAAINDDPELLDRRAYGYTAEVVADHALNLWDALDKHPRRADPITVYRGLHPDNARGFDPLVLFGEMQVGDEFDSDQFWSTSLQEAVSENFTGRLDERNGGRSVMLVITTRDGANVIERAELGEREAEVVLAPGTTFRVTAAYDPATMKVGLEEVVEDE